MICACQEVTLLFVGKQQFTTAVGHSTVSIEDSRAWCGRGHKAFPAYHIKMQSHPSTSGSVWLQQDTVI